MLGQLRLLEDLLRLLIQYFSHHSLKLPIRNNRSMSGFLIWHGLFVPFQVSCGLVLVRS